MDVKLGQSTIDMNSSSNVVCAPYAVKWQNRVSNLEVLHRCDTPSAKSQIIKAQLHWAGHLARSEDHRIPKALLFGQLQNGKRSVGRPRLTYKAILKYNLKECLS